ncbi:hypothetical protein A2153_01725 [Candidatus Gottesmanbacteria bacterium RBG_16_38_7b]|uniref:Sortase n=1 Tax=Candidatus Gottesmanbacteria bacterium RBG_16_38_7b TaxID=1798372 RepID=A0A1F5YGD3_9BACT|nr:MAG: hypothetical protein A2153_01725 [Candidatus Gottesmanbacteria bacterium RBG_16_38_7b]
MAIYSYSKTLPSVAKRIGRIISIVLILTGLTLIFAVLYPILTFELYYSRKYQSVISPVAEEENLPLKIRQALGATFTDLTEARLWFPKATPVKKIDNINNYSLSIPKLKIDNANVIIGGNDLSKSLIHFTGPSPGAIGNPVIFGHSTLLLFYNPKDYKAIFSKLPDLEIGDEIRVEIDKVSYVFRVNKMYITNPSDLSVLNQDTSYRELTLVTCVPPGTYFKRFIVKARLE